MVGKWYESVCETRVVFMLGSSHFERRIFLSEKSWIDCFKTCLNTDLNEIINNMSVCSTTSFQLPMDQSVTDFCGLVPLAMRNILLT